MSKKQPRSTPTGRKEKTGVPSRRRYTEGQAQCSLDKRSALDTATAQKATPNQAKFVHKVSASGSKGSADTSDHSKGATPKQIACRKWFNRVNEMGLRSIRKDFIEKIKTFKPDSTTTAFSEEANETKNRYDDVLLLDKTRVKVRINPVDDYIHASLVEVRADLSYICAQGPLSNTVSQFWLMCVQEDVRVILQLCLNIEDGNEKCSDYLLKEGDDWISYGSVQIKVGESCPIPATKKVTKTIIQCKYDDKEFRITHLLYSGWPDHSVAESVPTFREVRSIVHKLCEKKPIVLHCSAGIGRTGTFVAIEMVCHKLLNECNGDFSMIDLMHELRTKRTQAIQNDQQYSFIFRAVIEILVSENALAKSSKVVEFIRSYDDLVMRKKKQRSKGNAK